MMSENNWEGFPQKVALGALGIMFTVLIAYFVWLGTAMVEVRGKVTNIELAIKSLNETRQVTASDKSENNSRRLDALEGGENGSTKEPGNED